MSTPQNETKVSEIAEHLIGSEIIKLAGEVNAKIKQGHNIYNLTIGDFNSAIYPIPSELKVLINKAYENNETNYPAADGILPLREQVSKFLSHYGNINYSADEILITGGARPVIYSAYLTLLNPGEKVIFPIPSWNNNHYSYLQKAEQICIETLPENNFMPKASDIEPHIKDAALIALCSPLNPTGTCFDKATLTEICDLILAENKRRGPHKKPVYLLYDQIYWMLTFGNTEHYNPVELRPEMREYTIFVDGISKAFAATGVRVGWAFGPKTIIDKMKSVLGHIGAWAPKPEQVATAQYLSNYSDVDTFLSHFKEKLHFSLNSLYNGFCELQKEGYPVQAIAPQAAMYLTVEINLNGYIAPDGSIIKNTKDCTAYLLNGANFAVVPFSAFGTADNSNWYRISVGNCKAEDVPNIIEGLRKAFSVLKKQEVGNLNLSY